MKVKMLKTAAGPDFVYTVDKVYEIDDELAKALIEDKAAQPVGTEEKKPAPAARKAEGK